MRAIIYEQFGGALELREVPDPAPPADGVVIGVEANGICRSDWHGWMGHDPDIRLPHVPGHELAGIIEETGMEVRRWKIGDRVTVPFAVGCGRCAQCQSGNAHICDHYFQPGFTAWGSFAQFVAIPHADSNLVQIPSDLGFVESASLGCRFATAFRAVVTQGRARSSEWVVVHGCGGVGLAAIMIAHALGCECIGVDTKSEALDCALSLGALHVVNPLKECDFIQKIHDLTGGGAHVSLDALGSRETCRNSILCLRKRGRHIQVGLMVAQDRDSPVPMAQVIAKELEILGSHGMPALAYGPMLEMVRERRIRPERLVRNRVRLENAGKELTAMGEFRGVGVTVIDQF